MFKRKDLTGERFGRWTVIAYGHTSEKRVAYWLCRCDCGAVREVRTSSLTSGRSKSCGCLHREITSKIGKTINKTHGQFGTPLYFVWNSMKQRCGNPKSTSYPEYGDRGISVCEEWLRFEPFYEWANENGYSHGLSIDRIDNDGNYCPENCRWVNNDIQCRNRRSNVRFEYKGYNLTLPEWSEKTGINRSTLASRLFTYGWSIEKALTTPSLQKTTKPL